jgi:threonine aldolase
MFGSDNQAPAHPAVMEAVMEANQGRAGSYGDDIWTARALSAVHDVFETDDLDMYLVGTGSAANGVALSVLCPPWGAVLALGDAHVIADEGGAPEHFTSGARMIGIGPGAARVTPVHLEEAAHRFSRSNVHCPQIRAVTLTNLSENGLAYRANEVAALGEVCRAQGWGLHMDGARFASAIAGHAVMPAEVTWRAGVDALSLGLTKTGAISAEALLVFGQARSPAAAYLRKRAGHLFSKQRYLSAQVAAMLAGGLWLDLASHANAMARLLADIMTGSGVKLVHPVEGNEVFVHLLQTQASELTAAGIGFYPWAVAGDDIYRFVTCWQTSPADMDTVKQVLASDVQASK